ncbi:ATP synthase F1 subunit gamma [Candidatus Bariatricus faecipullorum]
MASAREIQNRIKSIQETMKITNAMFMISSSKLRKAKQKLEETRPYFYTLQTTIGRILRHVPDIDHAFFDERQDVKLKDRTIGYIVVTADKGLAGSYNHNVIKLAEEHMNRAPHNRLFVVGELGRQYFSKHGYEIDTHFHYTAQQPTMHRARIIMETLVEDFLEKKLDEVYMVYTDMTSPVQSDAAFIQLLPLKKATFSIPSLPISVRQEEIVLYPDAETVLDHIVPSYITGFIYGALVDSYSCEQNSRMMAMQTATDSAQKMLHELSTQYNRVRQTAITQEITEVIAGSKAQKQKVKR